MVDVGVAHDRGVDLIRVERKVAVPLPSDFAFPLIESAIEEQFRVAGFQQVHRPADGGSRSPECDGRLSGILGRRLWCHLLILGEDRENT